MIYTLTLNPALDISGTVNELIPNEKSYVHDEIQTPGGNGINAALIAHRLKAKVICTGFLGGPNGTEIKAHLNKEKLKHAFVPISGRTRMNLTVSNKKNSMQTRLSFAGPKIKATELRKLESFFDKVSLRDIVVIGGSLPPGVKPLFVSRLVTSLKLRGCTCLVDMPGKSLKDVIRSRPDFIKPNLVEFMELTGKKAHTIKAILPLVRKLNREVPLICVSSVEGGAILVTEDEAYYGKIPKVKVRSTVGAGDSMVGAIAAKLSEDPYTPIDELLRWGLAASCATLTQVGLILGSKKSILAYYPKIKIKKI